MNCKSIQEAIDTAPRRGMFDATVESHLPGCSDCRRHADEMSSLFSLLSAQPRVEAPADFDFRLRARIARAKAEPVRTKGILEAFWTRSFSLAQAGAAMAAVAVALTASTIYVTHRTELSSTTPTTVAVVTTPQTMVADAKVTAPAISSVETIKTPAARVARTTAVSYHAPKPAMMQPAKLETAAATTVARTEDSSRVYSRAHGVIPMGNRDSLIGAEGAAMAKTQTALSF